MVRNRVRAVSAALAAAMVVALALGTPVQASRVCIPFLSGTECVQFLEGRPDKPGLSKGMKIEITPQELTNTNELTVKIKGFKPNEGLRRFNYNIFGEGRMNEYNLDFRRADKKGNFTWVVAPSTSIYEPSWGQPALCVVGQRSGKLACAYFSVAADGSGGAGSPGVAPAPAATTPAPAATTPAPAPSSTGKCVDAGFTIICTS